MTRQLLIPQSFGAHRGLTFNWIPFDSSADRSGFTDGSSYTGNVNRSGRDVSESLARSILVRSRSCRSSGPADEAGSPIGLRADLDVQPIRENPVNRMGGLGECRHLGMVIIDHNGKI